MGIWVWTALFWGSFLTLFYTFLAYPALVWLASRLFPRPVGKKTAAEPPRVTVLLVACNEEKRLPGRLENLFASAYPSDQLEILVVSDGSTDGTAEVVENYPDDRVSCLEFEDNRGKARCLNAGIAKATSDIIVFADARQRFKENTIRELVDNFTDPTVGAVSGALMIYSSYGGVGKGIDLYWKLEKMIREGEALLDSCIGCTGAVYAIRRELYKPLAEDTLIDDVMTPMNITQQGYRVIHDPLPIAYDPQQLEPGKESIRKQRTLAGNFQMLRWHPEWLLPWKNRLWWNLISHKYLRLVSPLMLLIMMAGNLALIGLPFYQLFMVGQIVFYGLAIAGLARSGGKHRLIFVPGGFMFLNFMIVKGFIYYINYLTGHVSGGGWKIAGK